MVAIVKPWASALAVIVIACSTVVSKDLTKGLLLAVNAGDDSVALVDLERSAVIQKIATHTHPQDAVISLDRSLAYVAEIHETPLWIFEAWDWIIRGVLGLKREKPSCFDLPVMMRLTLSTPHHALRNLAKGPLTRPNNFMMIPKVCRFGCPANIDLEKFTLVTQFSSERDEWMNSKYRKIKISCSASMRFFVRGRVGVVC